MSKVEELLEQYSKSMDAKFTLSILVPEMVAKLREAVGLANLEELDNGYLRCRFCQATKFKGGTQIHKPDCKAQKFLEE